jgi:hypothetical protein
MDALSKSQRLHKEIIANTCRETDFDSIGNLVRNVEEWMEDNFRIYISTKWRKKKNYKRNEVLRKSKQMHDLYMDDAKEAFKWITDDI